MKLLSGLGMAIMFFPRALSDGEVVMLYEGGIKPVRCRRCDCYFVDRSELMRHVWTMHRRKQTP